MSDAREVLKNMLGDELTFMALNAVSSNKAMVKEMLITRLLQTFSKRGLTIKYGSGGMTYNTMIDELKKTPVYKWAVVVDTATTEEEFIEFILEEMDPSTTSKILTHTWREAQTLYSTEWKFKFQVPREKMGQAILRRKVWTRRAVAGYVAPLPVPVAPPRHWLEEVPADERHIIQMLSEQGSTPFQRAVIETILTNRFNENTVSQFVIEVLNPSKGNKFEISIKKI